MYTGKDAFTFGFWPRVLRSQGQATIFVTVNERNAPDFIDIPASCNLLL